LSEFLIITGAVEIRDHMYKIILIAFFMLPIGIHAQPFLKPSIGLSSRPQDTDPICSIPTYTGSFYTSGLQAGDTAYEFKFYDLSGDSILLSELLSTGKPLLIVNGNYTCPVFRNKVPMINQVASAYTGLVNIIILYTVEAHPTDISPYFGFVNVGTANTSAGILFPQPTTYLVRKNLVDTMLNNMTINAPVYIDGPCNNFWSVYGPAPNNAYLIKPDGIIFAKHGWFDRNPTDYILCDIDSLLYNIPCTLGSGAGNFSIIQKDTFVTGNAGSILYGFTDIINNTSSGITVSAKKLQKIYSSNWQTAFCADVCFSPSDDSITFTIPAYDTMHFSIDFITHAITDSGRIKIGFRNVNNITNQYAITVWAKTLTPSALGEIEPEILPKVFPNPVSTRLQIELNELPAVYPTVSILGLDGQVIYSQKVESKKFEIPVETLAGGFYLLKIGASTTKFIKQ
jgi:hypothetical protein